jgi:hypothetical protein
VQWAQTTESHQFEALMSPSAERPLVTDREAAGKAIIGIYLTRSAAGTITEALVDFDIEFFVGQPETLVAMHIHRAAAGASGPIVISSGGLDFTTPSVEAPVGSGRLFKQRVATSDATAITAIEGILANPANYYVNIHSTAKRPGLIRGQLQRTQASQLSTAQGVLDTTAANLRRLMERLGLIPQ